MEGFTSYYDELLLRRAGFYTQDQMLQKINSSVNYVEGSEGSRVQPVAHASFDAWIKAYRPNENSANTTMTYYTRGAMIAAMLDAKIVTKFKGKKSLDDFLQKLYKDFYKKLNRGFSEEEFEKALSEFMGEDMKPFLQAYVYDTKVPDFQAIFAPLGVKTEYNGTKKVNFGATFSNGIVKSVRANSAAENAGLSVNDEIIGINGYRIPAGDIDATLNSFADGELLSILIAREDILLELAAKMGSYERPSYRLSIDKPNDLLNYWLR